MSTEPRLRRHREESESKIINGSKVTTHPTGEVEVDFDPQFPIQTTSHDPNDHFANLVELLDPSTRASIAGTLVDRVNEDIQSRSIWTIKIAKALELLGENSGEENNYPFKGASHVYDPTFQECSTSICATVRAELLPAQGPVEIQNIGEADESIIESSQNVKEYMNYFLTKEYKSYYSETMKTIKWSVDTGSAFKKIFVNPLTGKIEAANIDPEDFIVNSKASSLEKATLVTHKFRVTAKSLRMMQLQGFYRDIKLSPFLQNVSEDSIIQETLQRKTGIDEDTYYDRNEYYELWECHVDLDVKGFEHVNDEDQPTGLPLPYLVIFEPESRQILRFCRNWKRDDKSFTRINIFVHYYFAEGLGFYGEGLIQKIGGLARAATNMTRTAQNSAQLAAFPGGLRAKSMRNESNEIRIGPLEFKEIDTGGLPISDAIMVMPYKDASPIMLQMIDGIQTSMKNISGAVMMTAADFNSDAPVGTTLALLERLNINQSSVMRNYHMALGEELRIMFELFKEILPDEPFPFKAYGNKRSIMRKDFHDDVDIIPISDPNLNSSALRMIRAQELGSMCTQFPDLFNARAINEMKCREMRIDPATVMTSDQSKDEEEVIPLDPISTCMNIMAGKPVKAGITQDHQAYLIILSNLEQQLMQDPENNADKIAALKALKQEHEIFAYQLQMEQMIGHKLPDDPSKLSPDIQNQLASKAAEAVQKAAQQQQEANPPPLDPATVMMEDVKVKAQLGEQRAQLDQLKIELETFKAQEQAKNNEQKYQLEMFKAQSQDELDRARDELARMKASSEEQLNYLKMEYESKIKDQELSLKQMQFELEVNKTNLEETNNRIE